MITVRMNQTKLMKDLNNVVDYSLGFLDGVQRGKKVFLNSLGAGIKEILEGFIDSNARSNPQALHHIYEWYKVGSPDARLFDISYTVSGIGLSFSSSFRQSNSIKDGSSAPFYNKAKIMEDGIPVVIKPKQSSVLVFEEDGETVFTKSPVEVLNPGGTRVEGSFERIVNMFFTRYFTQSFLRSSGVSDYLSKPVIYKQNISKGKMLGKSAGISTGYKWITSAGARING